MLKNLLVEYEGGGYDGCFWQYNYFMFDDSGKFVNLFSSGYKGIETENQAMRVIRDFIDYRKNGGDSWHNYGERTTIVNLKNKASVLQWANNTNGGTLLHLANEHWLLEEKLVCNCYECGNEHMVTDLFLDEYDYHAKDLFCESCHFGDDSIYIAMLKFENVTLKIGDVQKAGKYGRLYYSYVMLVDDKILFSGLDYSPSPMQSPDSLDSLIGLLGFLTVKEGDTDDEYFKDYTDDQLEFTQSNLCEELSMVCYDYENGEDFLIVDENDSGDMVVYTVSYKD